MLIIGTGPSCARIMGEDVSDLPCIGVNDALLYWSPAYYFALDRPYIVKSQQHRKHMVVFVWDHFFPFWRSTSKYAIPAWYSKGPSDIIESLDTGIAFGGSSTYAAMHMAAIMGCNPIYLIGNDLSWRPGQKSHIHKRRFSERGTKKFSYDGITYLTRTPMIVMKRNFETSKKFFDSKGIKVINLSDGILEKYPRQDAKKALSRIRATHSGFVPNIPAPGGTSVPWKKYRK